MTLRANITTTYRDANAGPPRTPKNVRKELADQGVRESEGTGNPMNPATKALDQGAVPLTEHGGNRSARRRDGQTPTVVDAFERSPLNDKFMLAQGAESDNPASNWRPDTNERETASKPFIPSYGPGSGGSTTRRNVGESPASHKYFAAITDRNQSGISGSIVKNLTPSESIKADQDREVSNIDARETQELLNQELPVSPPPKIHLAESFVNSTTDNSVTSPAANEGATMGVLDEGVMQRELIMALQFGKSSDDSSQTDSGTGGDVAKHLQSEGVFGISVNGRNLGTIDFIRQKQFEYRMDQKPFTTDDLLLEAEKAIHGTLNSDQSSAVSKSLLRAAESINAYRNQSIKSSEHFVVVAKSSWGASSTGKKED
jgi:hypothetical protein